MQNRLVPDFRPETTEEISETYTPAGSTEQTATYKIGTAHPIIGGILDKFTWIRTHVAAVWWNRLAGITLKSKIEQMDNAIAQLEGKIGMFNCSFAPNTIHDTSFADVLTDVRAQTRCVGFLSYYRISDAPKIVPNGFLVYFRNNDLGTQMTLLAFWANKMVIGTMTSNGSITWADI